MGMQSTSEIEALYHQFIDAWNQRNAHDYAALVAPDGNLVGFDGSQMNGRAEVEAELSRIFTDHPTARYVAKVRNVKFLSPEIAVLRAVVGMVPPGKSDINPDRNAIQSLVATRHTDHWHITLFQNTPAKFDGRPELTEALNAELRDVLREESKKGIGSKK